MKKPKTKTKLDEHEWNFSGVDADELVACCYWEYARESKFIRDATKLMADIRDGKWLRKPLGTAQEKLLERLHIICKRPDQDPDHFYRCPPFPQPWQSLDKAHKPPQMLKIPPEQYAFQIIDSRLPWSRFQRQTEGRVISHGTETVLVKIDWGAGSNSKIKKSFNKWLDKNRPAQIPEPSERGHHKPNVDCRARLERLGLLRLRHHYTFDEAKPFLHKLYPPCQSTQSQPPRKFDCKGEYNREANYAVDDFHALFPFLDPAEMPHSWRSAPAVD
ncbi:MAG: hypothetical protein ACLPRE_01090 [Limisphaerales bacterium]